MQCFLAQTQFRPSTVKRLLLYDPNSHYYVTVDTFIGQQTYLAYPFAVHIIGYYYCMLYGDNFKFIENLTNLTKNNKKPTVSFLPNCELLF